MYRAAGVSYLRYSTEMADLLRQCLKSPLREKAITANTVHMQEKVWQNGIVASKVRYDGIQEAFKATEKAQAK